MSQNFLATNSIYNYFFSIKSLFLRRAIIPRYVKIFHGTRRNNVITSEITIPVCEFKFDFAIRFPWILSILVTCKAITSLLSGRSKFLPSCDTDSGCVTWFPRGTEYRHFAKRPYNSYDQICTHVRGPQ